MSLLDDSVSSWAEAVKSIEQSKKTLSWDLGDESLKVKRINLREQRIKERELDPVTMKFRDENAESRFQTTRLSSMQRTLERAKTATENNYNIISHKGPSKDTVLPKINLDKFHLISHLTVNDHSKAPIKFNEDYVNSKYPKKVAQTAGIAKRRDFNLINNEYYDDNDSRVAKETRHIKEEVSRKFWDTHVYNPVMGNFYNYADEEKFNDRNEKMKCAKNLLHMSKVPPSILNAEGNAYNIVNHEGIDEDKLNITNSIIQSSVLKAKQVALMQETLKQEKIARVLRDEERHKHRVRFDRWKEEVGRGFDPIKNIVVDTKDPLVHAKVFPAVPRPPNVWERVTMTSSSNNRTFVEGSNTTSFRDLSGSNTSAVLRSVSPIVSGSSIVLLNGGLSGSNSCRSSCVNSRSDSRPETQVSGETKMSVPSVSGRVRTGGFTNRGIAAV